MPFEINVSRDMRGDLRAETRRELPDNRVLIVSTRKTSGKTLATWAEVHTRENGFLSHRFVMFGDALDGDYRRKLAESAPGTRCTAKALEAQQAEAIDGEGGIDALVSFATTHYELKAKRDAAKAAGVEA